MRAFLLSMRVVLRGAFFVMPLCVAAWAAGCSDEDPPAGPGPDAGSDAAPDTAAPSDSGTDTGSTKRNCAGDLQADGIWGHLECSGLYESFADKKLAADVKPYKPGVEFWSDGAEKNRFVYLPPNSKIDITIFDEWVYPVGTKLWKEFKLQGKRIETRLFTKTPDGTWAHTAYRWSNSEDDAFRKDSGEKIPGLGPDGGIYEIPSTGQCNECHEGRSDQILGFDAVSMGLPTATGQTLATLAAEGKLSAAPPKTSLTFPNAHGDKAAPAIGWLHANCGSCHNNNGAAASRAHFLVRASELAPSDGGAPATVQELDAYTQGYCKPTGRQEPADAGAADAGGPYLYLRGAEPTRSLMSILSGQRAPVGTEPSNLTQMPPLVSRAVDVQGHKLLDDWIAALPPCP